ncbi:protein RICE SALT SENSITIVE 3 [Triticum urartu]|uniref:Transcription factor MYC/MYB N-terminal domain-containing protein n=1 Tax=Triticum urartu TaxID=4572 RepID=A0A8R7V3T2_TRIUA|nr:protein RICE SALT SENSITIVE 3 [Triticum urartu]
MEEQLSPVAVTHLLQHTLRSLCTSDASQWVYAVFWRILPRNYPPPKWDLPGVAYDRTRGNRRNWILAWEDGFCNFAATTSAAACGQEGAGGAAAAYADCEAAAAAAQEAKQGLGLGLQPELFFKMSHDIYNYGEGLIGKVAADHSHKWIFKEPPEQEISLISSWSNPADSQPRTWEAQFQSGIQTIALIAVREGVVQLGSMKKVAEDLSYVVTLRRKFGYLESIPGVLLPHPSSAGVFPVADVAAAGWPGMMPPPDMYVDPYVPGPAPMHIMPSMSSLEALLSKLPSVVPAPPQPPGSMPGVAPPSDAAAKEEAEEDYNAHCHAMDMSSVPSNGGESTSTSAAANAATPMSSYFLDVGGKPSEAGF